MKISEWLTGSRLDRLEEILVHLKNRLKQGGRFIELPIHSSMTNPESEQENYTINTSFILFYRASHFEGKTLLAVMSHDDIETRFLVALSYEEMRRVMVEGKRLVR